MNTKTPSADVAIIGAGPIGIELAITLQREGVNLLHFDAQQIGYTISWWPRETIFFSSIERIELAGVPIPNSDQQHISGEGYLAYLRALVEQFDLPIRTYQRVTTIQPEGNGFLLLTQTQTGEFRYHVKKVIVATGDMQRPNYLNIPGENLPHIDHYFVDPHRYFRTRLLIVGGRNSAVEAALRCWRSGAEVVLSYRCAEFDSTSVKHFILPDLLTQIELGTIQFLPETIPVAITPALVVLAGPDSTQIQQPADFVLMLTGFVGDMSIFEDAGVSLVGAGRAPQHNNETMETNVPGLYVAGTAVGGERKARYSFFIENCHVHVGRIVQHITGRWPDKLGAIPARSYQLPLEDIQAN